MAKNKGEDENLKMRIDKEWFEENGVDWIGKRMTISLIYYSFPSNQNGSGGEGTNVISQKIMAWGENAEPRIYVSPYALKRRIRDWWAAHGEKVGFISTKIEEIYKSIGEKKEEILDYIDFDLFGYMHAEKGGNKSALARAAPITTWGAISLEPYHSFLDFNTCVYSTSGSGEGGSIFNRLISKEFYFSSFHVNLDLISVNYSDPKNSRIDKRIERLERFLNGVLHAMEKEAGGPRDKGACILAIASIGDKGFPTDDKKIFKSIKIENDKIVKIKLPKGAHIFHIEECFFDDEVLEKMGNKEEIRKIVEEALTKTSL